LTRSTALAHHHGDIFTSKQRSNKKAIIKNENQPNQSLPGENENVGRFSTMLAKTAICSTQNMNPSLNERKLHNGLTRLDSLNPADG